MCMIPSQVYKSAALLINVIFLCKLQWQVLRLARPGNNKRFYSHDASMMSRCHDDDRIIAVQPMVICFSWEKQVSVAPKDVYRLSIVFFPHHYSLTLTVNKSPAVYIISPAPDRLRNENRGSVNRLAVGRLQL